MNIGLIGKSGEDRACRFLKRKGYKIVDRNYFSRFGEIDIIAQNKEYLVFVEVKTRSNFFWGYPAEAVDKEKFKHNFKNMLTSYPLINNLDAFKEFNITEETLKEGKILRKTLNNFKDDFLTK